MQSIQTNLNTLEVDSIGDIDSSVLGAVAAGCKALQSFSLSGSVWKGNRC